MKKIFIASIFSIFLFSLVFEYKNRSFNIYRVNYYGQRLERSSEFLIKRANYEDIPYNYGNKSEMYSINHESTSQTTGGYDYRYIGKKANNYIYFNCVDDNNCELWRIIGVFYVEDEMGNFNYRVKIVRNDSVGRMIFDNNSNDFVNSNIQYYLNHDYYNSLTDVSKKMVGMTKYYLSGGNNSLISGNNFYNLERSNFTDSSIDFVCKVGLMYPSDYLYTYYQVDDVCYENISICNNLIKSWMGNYSGWTLTPVLKSNNVYSILSGNTYNSSNDSLDVYPVLYLRFDTIISDGDGTVLNPYRVISINKGNVIDENEFIGDKSMISVDDTMSNKSLIILISSLILILVGLIIVLKNYFKSLNGKKNI